MTEVKIRDLKAKDCRRMAQILAKSVPYDAASKLLSKGKDVDAGKVGYDIIVGLVNQGSDDVWAFIADVAGISTDELDEKPVDYPIQVVKAIVASGAFDFFRKASGHR